MEWDGKQYVLSTGKMIDVFKGIIGINHKKVVTEGSHGSDGKVPTGEKDHPVTYISWRDCIMWWNEQALSKEELIEVADYMINMWGKFKEEIDEKESMDI